MFVLINEGLVGKVRRDEGTEWYNPRKKTRNSFGPRGSDY